MTLQEQAWASASPQAVLAELQKLHKLTIEGDKIALDTAPSLRLAFQIRRHKPKLLELLGASKTIQERISEAQKALGWKDKPEVDYVERKAIQSEPELAKAIPCDFDPDTWEPTCAAPWETPEIDRSVKEFYCQHPEPKHFRRQVKGSVVIQLLCPECGHNLKGPRRYTPTGKRSTVPWWPEDSPVVPDPDAETDELVEWWQTAQAEITDGSIFSQGVKVDDASKFRERINELIALWRLGDPDFGLRAQLKAHKAWRDGHEREPSTVSEASGSQQ